MYKILVYGGRQSGRMYAQFIEMTKHILEQSDKEVTVTFVDQSSLTNNEIDDLKQLVRNSNLLIKEELINKLNLLPRGI